MKSFKIARVLNHEGAKSALDDGFEIVFIEYVVSMNSEDTLGNTEERTEIISNVFVKTGSEAHKFVQKLGWEIKKLDKPIFEDTVCFETNKSYEDTILCLRWVFD